METKFNLSEKIDHLFKEDKWDLSNPEEPDCIEWKNVAVYYEEDVKEFIRLLKEKGSIKGIPYKQLEKRFKIQIRNGQTISGIKAGILFMIQELDKLAGDKLI
jgi:hypothetical protein